MHYDDLEIYDGSKTACDYCGRAFRKGEVLVAADDGALIFCEINPADGGCMVRYLFFKLRPPRPLLGTAQVFREHAAPGSPDTPLTSGQRIRRALGFHH